MTPGKYQNGRTMARAPDFKFELKKIIHVVMPFFWFETQMLTWVNILAMSQRNLRHQLLLKFCAAGLEQYFQLDIGNSRSTFLFILRGGKGKKRK